MTIIISTLQGKAAIVTGNNWTESGEYKVVGAGASSAKEWLENAYGAYGHFIGTHAAPMDIHCAAMLLRQTPENGVTFMEARDVPNKPYATNIPQGAIT